MKFLAGIAIIVAGAVFMMLINGNWELRTLVMFADAPSLIVLLLALAGTVTAARQWGLFGRAVKAAFCPKQAISKDECTEGIELFLLLRKSSIYAGVLIAMVGLVITMGNLRDVEITAANTALAILGIFYAVFVNLAFINPVIGGLQRRLRGQR
ncbi:MAG: hypothetical protein FWB74_07335 [Defluviitaleaceae bacterium]|nr:hypothetical protein [Defluviitaleaceae bacterium]